MANPFSIEELGDFPFDRAATPTGVPSNVAMKPALLPSSITSLLAARAVPPAAVRTPSQQMARTAAPPRADRFATRALDTFRSTPFAPPAVPSLPRGQPSAPSFASPYARVPTQIQPGAANCAPPQLRVSMSPPAYPSSAVPTSSMRYTPTKPEEVPCRGSSVPASASPPLMRPRMTSFPWFQPGNLGAFDLPVGRTLAELGAPGGPAHRFTSSSARSRGAKHGVHGLGDDGFGDDSLADDSLGAAVRSLLRAQAYSRSRSPGKLRGLAEDMSAIPRLPAALRARVGARANRSSLRGFDGLGTPSVKAPGTECPATGSWETYCQCMFDVGTPEFKACSASWPFAPWTIVGKLLGSSGGASKVQLPNLPSGGGGGGGGGSGTTSTALPDTGFNFPGSGGASGSSSLSTPLLIGAAALGAAGIGYALYRRSSGSRRRR